MYRCTFGDETPDVDIDADHYQKILNPKSRTYEYHFYSDEKESDLTHLITIPALFLVGDPVEVKES